jgi:hypothetical protein
VLLEEQYPLLQLAAAPVLTVLPQLIQGPMVVQEEVAPLLHLLQHLSPQAPLLELVCQDKDMLVVLVVLVRVVMAVMAVAVVLVVFLSLMKVAFNYRVD